MRNPIVLLPWLAFALPAQTVWNVPNGADLAPWIAQASPGDTLQLGATHTPFVLNKGLVLLGIPTGTTIAPVFMPVASPIESSLTIPSGQRARVAGIRFTGATGPWGGFYPPSGQRVVVQGAISLEDCVFEYSSGAFPIEGAVDVLGGEVAMVRCNVMSRSHDVALRVVAGVCTITDTVLTGPSANVDTHTGWSAGINVALWQQGGVVIASRLVVQGGHSICPLCSGPGAEGILVAAGATMFLTDSVVLGGDPVSSGLVGHPGVLLARNTILAGSGQPTAPVVGAVVVPELVGLIAPAGPRLGQTFLATAMSSAPAAILAFFCAFDWTATTLPPFPEPWLLPAGQAITLALHAPAPGNNVVYGLAVPNVAALVGVQLWIQAAQVANGTLHASPLVGGTIR